jgi:single-strand DNA-binding protein
MNLNKVQIAGRLTRDPEVRFTTSGTAISDISLAVSRFWKNDKGESQEETDFINATAFGHSAEIIEKHLHKGSPIFVKQTGAKRSKLKVIAKSMQFVGPKPQASEPTPSAAPARTARTSGTGRTRLNTSPSSDKRSRSGR